MPQPDRATRTPVSIVCVSNDPDVLRTCLARSIRDGSASAPHTEFIPVDNRDGRFRTAGAALNHGARQARSEVVVFVHQDVVLHSLGALEEAAAIVVADPGIGVAGAVGIDSRHRILGRIRDRVVLIGESAAAPRDVDSLDEVLLVIRRDRVLREPLSEDPQLAWHAYGVEYSARSREAALRAVAIDIPLTHNSLTTNVDALDVAHRRVGELHPDLVPIRTTCGTVWGGEPPGRLRSQLRRMRSARVWWRESLTARALSAAAPGSPVILADVRILIDEMLARGGMESLEVLDLDAGGGALTTPDGVLRLGRRFTARTASVAEAREAIAGRAPKELLLLTSVTPDHIAQLGPLSPLPHVVGHSHETGSWVINGIPAPRLESLWAGARNRPFAGLVRMPRRAHLAPGSA